MPTWRIDGTHRQLDSAHRCHICAGTRLTAATCSRGLASSLPHLLRDSIYRSHICVGTGFTTTIQNVRRDQAHCYHYTRTWAQCCHICTGTPLTAATSPPCLGSPMPYVCRDWAQRCRLCVETQLTSVPFAFRLDSQVPHLHLSQAHFATAAPHLDSPLRHLLRD
jgi:hypothetical protein